MQARAKDACRAVANENFF